MNLLIVLHFDLLPFFLNSLTEIMLVARTQRVPGVGHGGNWHRSWLPGLTFLPAAISSPDPTRQTSHKAGSQWHSIFYFLKLYTNVKYFNSKSMGKLFGFKLL